MAPTAQIGVLKRCLRLIQELVEDFEIHLLNFGPLPDKDPLVKAMLSRIYLHHFLNPELGPAIMDIYQKLQPNSIILGEAPLAGSMRTAYRVGVSLGLNQIGIDNYYGRFSTGLLKAFWPGVDRWLQIGLLENGQPNLSLDKIEIVSPLIRFPVNFGNLARDRICLLGYDQQTLQMGLRLIPKLPPSEKMDIFVSPTFEGYMERLVGSNSRGPNLRIHGLPTDSYLCQVIAMSKFMIAKNGFQQIVEGVNLGAPVICKVAPGGVDELLLPKHLKPFIRYVQTEQDMDRIMVDMMLWLARSPSIPWARRRPHIADPVAFAASRLVHLINE